MLDNFNVNLHKNKGFLTYIPYIPIPDYGQSNASLMPVKYLRKCDRGNVRMHYSFQSTERFFHTESRD